MFVTLLRFNGTLLLACVLGGMTSAFASEPSVEAAAAKTKEHAAAIILPGVQFSGASVEEVMEFFRIKGRELDPSHEGINFIAKVPAAKRGKTISLNLRKIPLSEAVRYASEMVGLEVVYAPYAILVREPGAPPVSRPDPAQSAEAQKAASIVFPSVQFSGANMAESAEFFRVKALDLDPSREGFNILVKPGVEDRTISIDVKRIPALDALCYIADLADLKVTAEAHALVLEKVK